MRKSKLYYDLGTAYYLDNRVIKEYPIMIRATEIVIESQEDKRVTLLWNEITKKWEVKGKVNSDNINAIISRINESTIYKMDDYDNWSEWQTSICL